MWLMHARLVSSSALAMHCVRGALARRANRAGAALHAANFRNGTVDVFDSSFNQVNSFTDPNLPPGHAPFNVQVLDNKLYVTFAKQDVARPARGFVDAFDLNGNMLDRVASRGVLNSPWGLDIAPKGFGQFSGDLLAGILATARSTPSTPRL
jgi:uncharacterized protein (TIGR03118 family)